MSTIITVHGTNATGPEFGDRWWQRGSPFEKHLRELVECEDGELTFAPLIWDGANSEASRRKAATSLVGLIKKCEERQRPYCLIGHSHGGSIIAQALMHLGCKRRPPTMLKRWITIGTPFIAFSKSPLLFSRLGLIGKSIYVTFITSFVLFMLVFLYAISKMDQLETNPTLRTALIAVLTACTAAPFLFTYFIMRISTRRQFFIYSRKPRRRCAQTFSPLWVGLRHPSDEAICGLRAIKDIRLDLFSRNFATPAFALLSIFIVPAAIAVAVTAPGFATGLYNFLYPTGGTPFTPTTYTESVFMVGGLIIYPVFMIAGDMSKQSNAVFALTLIVTAIPAALFVISLIITLLVGIIASGISIVSSKVLNLMSNLQIKKSAFGSDMRGEIARSADASPVWIDSGFSELPEALSKEISEFSDAEAAKSLSKLRMAVAHLTFSDSGGEKANFVQSYLGWNELIHTCYFNVPRFRKLVAYAVATTEGFRASEQFRRDPDFDLVKGWYQEMMPKPTPGVLQMGSRAA